MLVLLTTVWGHHMVFRLYVPSLVKKTTVRGALGEKEMLFMVFLLFPLTLANRTMVAALLRLKSGAVVSLGMVFEPELYLNHQKCAILKLLSK